MREGVDGEALNDFPGAVGVGADGHGGEDAFFDAVGAVGAYGNGVPVACGCREAEATHCVNGCGSSGGGGGKSTCLDDGGATLLNGGDELTLEPVDV